MAWAAYACQFAYLCLVNFSRCYYICSIVADDKILISSKKTFITFFFFFLIGRKIIKLQIFMWFYNLVGVLHSKKFRYRLSQYFYIYIKCLYIYIYVYTYLRQLVKLLFTWCFQRKNMNIFIIVIIHYYTMQAKFRLHELI